MEEERQNNNGCKYCIPARTANAAWKKQPIIDRMLVSSNINGTFPHDDMKRHKGLSVRIKDYGGVSSDNDDPGYLEHIKQHPAALEIQSVLLGEKVFRPIEDKESFPLIIEIEIRYCPFCGRRLGGS